MRNFCIWWGALAVCFDCLVFGGFSHCDGERSLLLRLLQYCIVLRDFFVWVSVTDAQLLHMVGGIGGWFLFFGARVVFTL